MIVLGFIAVLIFLELLVEYRRDWRARWFDVVRTALLWSLAVVSGVLATVFVAVTVYSWLGWVNPLPYWFQLLSGFLLADYVWYWFHRWSHGSGWRFHVWHHVVSRLNIWMTHVGHPIFNFLAAMARLVPLLLVGLDPSVITLVGVVQVVWTTAVHLNVPVRTTSLNRYLITPEVHRWHHAPGARVNLGLCLSVWDRLHGTYACPGTGPGRVGLKHTDIASYPDENSIMGHLVYPLVAGGKGGIKRSARLPPPAT